MPTRPSATSTCRTQNLKSDYSAFTATINKRFANGWSWYTAYTYGIAKDENSDYFGEGDTGSGTVMEAVSNERIGDEYGYAQFDRRHRVVGGMIFDMPFFKNSKNWFLRNVVAGWQISSNFHFTSGAGRSPSGPPRPPTIGTGTTTTTTGPFGRGRLFQELVTWTNGRPGWDKSMFAVPNYPSGRQ